MATDMTRIGKEKISERLTEELDVWEIRLSGSVEGLENNEGVEPREAPVYSTMF